MKKMKKTMNILPLMILESLNLTQPLQNKNFFQKVNRFSAGYHL